MYQALLADRKIIIFPHVPGYIPHNIEGWNFHIHFSGVSTYVVDIIL